MNTRTLDNKKLSILLLVAIMIPFTFISMTKNCFSSAMVFIVDEGILTKFQTGTITAFFYVIYAILQIIGGVVTDKWKPERFITIGLLGAAISNFIIFFNQNYIVMLLAWTFNGIAQFAVWPAVFKIAGGMLHESHRDAGLFIVLLANPMGQVLSYVVAAIVSSYWQLNFLVSAIGLTAIAILWECGFAYVKPHLISVAIEQQKSHTGTAEEKNIGFWKTALSAGLIIAFIITLSRSAFDLGIKALAPTMINESYLEVSPVLATVMNIIILLSGVGGSFFAKLIYPRFLRNESVIIILFFIAALPLVCLMLTIGNVSYWVIIALMAVIVFLMSGASVFTSSYIAARFSRWGKDATVAGILNSGAALGIVAANMGFTAIADATDWNITILVWILVMVVSILLIGIFIPMWTKFLKKSKNNI